jgi:FXSXX-COOH protein
LKVSGESSDVGGEVPVDVSHLPLTDLLRSDDTALAVSLRRVLADLDNAPESFAAFANTP